MLKQVNKLNKLNKQHDAFARKYLSNIDVAKEFLSIYLEPEILVKCDIATLQIDNKGLLKTGFINKLEISM